MTAKTFRDAYDTLQRHAAMLREQREPNIDDLLTVVTEAVDAYKVCKERIDSVEKALDRALADAGAPATAASEESGHMKEQAPVPAESPRPPLAKERSTSFDAMDDDIPF